MTTISHVRGCDPQSMITFAGDLTARNETFSIEVERANRDVDNAMNNWRGEAATAASARKLSEELASNHLDQAIVTLADHYNTYGAELSGYRTALLSIVDIEVPGAGMTVDDAGTVSPPRVPTDSGNTVTSGLVQQLLDAQAASFQTRVKTLLAQFGDAENVAAQAIIAGLQGLDSYETNPDGAPPRPQVQDILDNESELPADPKRLHDFWETLTPAEKNALWEHDQYLGNRDGLPAIDRDHFNRLKLDDELARAVAGDPAVEDKLADLQAVQSTVGDNPDRKLMVLDSQSGEMTHAAVAVGNPDTADNVSVTAGGLNTTVGGSLGGMVGEAEKLKDTAEGALSDLPLDDPRRDGSVATVAWIGSDLPQAHLNPDEVTGYTDVATDGMAKEGAPALASFYNGLGAAHEGDPHITAVGHSYGSLMTGLALQEPGGHPVDDAVVYGSPGLGLPNTALSQAAENAGDPGITDMVTEGLGGSATDTSKLGLGPGHMYEMTAHGDGIAHLGAFGPSPADIPGFTHLETDAATTADGVHRDESTGHGNYPRVGSHGELRTSGWNTAMIVAGLPKQAEEDTPKSPMESVVRYTEDLDGWIQGAFE